MRLIAEYRQGNLRQRLALGIEADLPADLERPARIDILLCRLVRVVGPDLPSAFASLDRRFLGIRAGDVILGVGTSDITDVKQFEAVLGRFEKASALPVTVLRGNWASFVRIPAAR
jgi:hypothetical protein